MFLELFVNQGIAAGATIYSQPFDIGADNGIFGLLQVTSTGATGTFNVKVDASNDMTNWIADYASLLTSTVAVGLQRANATNLVARYLRLRVSNPAGGTTVFNLSVNSKNL